LVLEHHCTDPESDRHSHERPRCKLRGSEGAVAGLLVASLEASAGMMRDDHGRRRTAMNNGLIYALGLLSIVGGLVVAAVLMWNLT
jgi:hypothetical protein